MKKARWVKPVAGFLALLRKNSSLAPTSWLGISIPTGQISRHAPQSVEKKPNFSVLGDGLSPGISTAPIGPM